MKIGYRKPSLKKSFKARTTGKINRSLKKSVNPTYGRKGIGFVKNPKKSIKNAVYHKTTVSVFDTVKSTKTTKSSTGKTNGQEAKKDKTINVQYSNEKPLKTEEPKTVETKTVEPKIVKANPVDLKELLIKTCIAFIFGIGAACVLAALLIVLSGDITGLVLLLIGLPIVIFSTRSYKKINRR